MTAYQYSTGTNRLQSATIDGIGYSLSYDANGAITWYDRAGTGDDTFIAWNARQLPVTIVVGSSLSDPQPTAKDEFRYGPDGARFYKRSTWDDGGAQRVEHTFYVGPFEELLTDPSDPSHQAVQKSRIGSSLLHVRKIDHALNATESIEYLHRDHLGSIEAVTDAQGAVVRDLAHDPFGTRRRDDGSRELDDNELAGLADELRKGGGRGFTGHENLDRTGFVHMNGRVYDPRLGRFLSPDPVIQAPRFSQNWNRYSYVMNSPVSFTDPSGYITQGPMCGGLVMCINPGGNGGGGGGGSASSTYTTTSQAHIVNVSVSMQSRPVYGWVRVPVFNAQFGGSSIDPNYSTSYEWQRQQIDTSVSANAQTSSSAVQVTQQRTVSENGETDGPMQSDQQLLNKSGLPSPDGDLSELSDAEKLLRRWTIESRGREIAMAICQAEYSCTDADLREQLSNLHMFRQHPMNDPDSIHDVRAGIVLFILGTDAGEAVATDQFRQRCEVCNSRKDPFREVGREIATRDNGT